MRILVATISAVAMLVSPAIAKLEPANSIDREEYIDYLATLKTTKDVEFLRMFSEDVYRDTLCAAATIYHESRGEPKKGQIAVAHVIQNRSSKRRQTLCEVVWHPWQFEWTTARLPIEETGKWKDALELVYKVQQNRYEDPTLGADHFYNPYKVKPSWACAGRNKVMIGDHVFMSLDNSRSGCAKMAEAKASDNFAVASMPQLPLFVWIVLALFLLTFVRFRKS